MRTYKISEFDAFQLAFARLHGVEVVFNLDTGEHELEISDPAHLQRVGIKFVL